MSTTSYTQQGLMPAFAPEKSVKRPVRLPVGGPVGTGGAFGQGLALGCIGGAAQNEIRLLTITGTPTGFNGTIYYTADKVYSAALPNLVSAIPTAAQLQATLEEIFGEGNVTVTKASLVYAITFAQDLADVRIGGAISISASFTAGTAPAAAFSTSQQGSAGAGQYDVYSQGSNNRCDCFLENDFLSDPLGARSGEFGSGSTPFSPPAYFEGFFNVDDLTGLDANALTLGKLTLAQGTAITDDGAVVRLIG